MRFVRLCFSLPSPRAEQSWSKLSTGPAKAGLSLLSAAAGLWLLMNSHSLGHHLLLQVKGKAVTSHRVLAALSSQRAGS